MDLNFLSMLMFIYFVVSIIIFITPIHRMLKQSYSEMLEYLYSKNMIEEIKIIEDYIYGISSFSQRKELSNFYEKITQDEYLNNLKQKYLNNRKLIMKKFIKYIIFVFMSIIMFIIILFLLEFI